MLNDPRRKLFLSTAFAAALAITPAAALAVGMGTSSGVNGGQHPAMQAGSQSAGGSANAGSAVTGQFNRKQTVRKVQQALDRTGANLKVDGIEGRKTRQALKSFQRNHGLRPTGNINLVTRNALLNM